MDGLKLLLTAVAGVIGVGVYGYRQGWFTWENMHRAGGHFWGSDDDINVDTTSPQIRRPARDEVCSVCLNPILDPQIDKNYLIVMLMCGHWFHRNCLLRMQHYSSTCPVCRRIVDFNSLHMEMVRCEPRQDARGSRNSTGQPGPNRRRPPPPDGQSQDKFVKPRSRFRDDLDLD